MTMRICLSVRMYAGCLKIRLLLLLADDLFFIDLMRLDVVIELDLVHLRIANWTISLPTVLHLGVLLHKQFEDFVPAYLASLRLIEVLR